ncbi:HdeD family acid-resistance protein [Enterococcus sp. AZ126]|uniref:HdeD family acid-resistance protein n=1 Tax=Enterococcus sp. AZ126 TaxID=2774635 RepID=UPI003F23B158
MAWIKYGKIGSFILGMSFIGLAIFTFENPVTVLRLLVIFFSIVLILKGIFELYSDKNMKQWSGYYSNLIALIGIIDLLIGTFFFSHLTLGMFVLPFAFATWLILFFSIRCFRIVEAKELNTVYRNSLFVVNSLGIIIGFLFLFNPTISALTLIFWIGISFLLFGITRLKYAMNKN